MSVDTKRLSGNTDALAWAEEFVKEFDGEAIGDSRLDTGTMIGWFANAIETGRAAGEADSRGPEARDSAAPEPGPTSRVWA